MTNLHCVRYTNKFGNTITSVMPTASLHAMQNDETNFPWVHESHQLSPDEVADYKQKESQFIADAERADYERTEALERRP